MSSDAENPKPQCVIDRNVVNQYTVQKMEDIALSFFATACGKNRGAFVLDEPDGQTYSCLRLPAVFSDTAGQQIESVEDIKRAFLDGSLSPAKTVDLLDMLVRNVYGSTPNTDKTLYACDFNGLTTLAGCPSLPSLSSTTSDAATRLAPDDQLIRAVAMAGVFVPAEWVTGRTTALALDEAATFYTNDDFVNMATIGVNTVQIPIPASMISDDAAAVNVLASYLAFIADANLHALLVLEVGDETDAAKMAADVVAAARFCVDNSSVIIGMQLPIKDRAMMDQVQLVSSDLALFLPINEGEIETFDVAWKQGMYPDKIFAALELSHTSNVADIASSDSKEDRSKLFYHEATACIIRSPLEFAKCYGHNTEIYVASGFDLSIDNCILKDSQDPSVTFKDYGQCDRFNETVGSPWWHRHRESYAARQLFAYEQGLGWSFAAWKLYRPDGSPTEIEEPADLLALETVVAAGLFPNLNTDSPSAHLACLNPPETDFAMGDATFAPTLGPPPDCGNGWWNYTTNACSYWVPPPTNAPTGHPTISCPACDDCELLMTEAVESMEVKDPSHSGWVGPLALGVLLGAVCAYFIPKLIGDRKRSEYTPVADDGHEIS